MQITFYGAPQSSAYPVAWALAELEVPHERVVLDLKAKEQRRPDFLKLNPNGKVPTLVVDGNPLFEALAIVTWLGERFGVERKMWPEASKPERGMALSWSAWAYVTYGAVANRLFLGTGKWHGEAFRNSAHVELAQKELAELNSILNDRLARQTFMLGDSFTLVDVTVASAVGYACMGDVSLEAYPRLKAWLDTCQARPAARAAGQP